MSPIEHDLLMADLQFLSHSMFLILADCYTSLPTLPIHPLLSAVKNAANRILRGQAHVYGGIARNNPANEKFFKQWYERINTIPATDVVTLTMKIVRVTEEVSATFGKNHGSVSTPISRMRKQLSSMAFCSLE